MKAIETAKEFKNIISEPALISIFLDDGLERGFITEALSIWKTFNRANQHRWHFVFPVVNNEDTENKKGAYTINDHLNPDMYDTELAENIAKQLGVPATRFPAVVFLGHDESDYFVLSLRSRSGSEWRNHFREIAKICLAVEAECERTNSMEYYKQDVARHVRRYLSLHVNFRKIAPAMGFFSNLLGIPSSMVTIAD